MLRPSRKNDQARLYEIWHGAVKATHHFLPAESFAEIADLVRDQYLPSRDFLVHADEGDIPRAFMGTNDGEIESLFVDPQHFGKGIGRTFIDHMKRLHDVVTLEVNEQNPQAVGFYEICGFTVVRRDATDDHGRPFPILHMRWTR